MGIRMGIYHLCFEFHLASIDQDASDVLDSHPINTGIDRTWFILNAAADSNRL